MNAVLRFVIMIIAAGAVPAAIGAPARSFVGILPCADCSAVDYRLDLNGLFTYFADSAMIEDCTTGRQMPVAMEGDYLLLERTWLRSGRGVDQPLHASLRARIEERVNMEGPSRPTVIIEAVLEVTAEGGCAR